MRLDVLLENSLVGWLGYDPATNRLAFDYAPSWLVNRERFALSPQLPLNPKEGGHRNFTARSSDSSSVDLIHVPEPVLVIERFDRLVRPSHVQRIHLIDGCQALGLSSAFKC